MTVLTNYLLQGSTTAREGDVTDRTVHRVQVSDALAAHAKRYTALYDPGLPADLDPHPTIPNIVLVDREARATAESENLFDVSLTWGRQSESLARDGGFTGTGLLRVRPDQYTIETHLDRDSNPMVVSYTGSAPGTGTFALNKKTTVARKEVYSWTATLTKDFALPRYTDNDLAGQVNNATFGPGGAETLLYRGVQIEANNDPALPYRHTYTFSYNVNQWAFFSYVTFGGFLPEDAATSVQDDMAIGQFFIYSAFNMSLLPVSFPPGA